MPEDHQDGAVLHDRGHRPLRGGIRRISWRRTVPSGNSDVGELDLRPMTAMQGGAFADAPFHAVAPTGTGVAGVPGSIGCSGEDAPSVDRAGPADEGHEVPQRCDGGEQVLRRQTGRRHRAPRRTVPISTARSKGACAVRSSRRPRATATTTSTEAATTPTRPTSTYTWRTELCGSNLASVIAWRVSMPIPKTERPRAAARASRQ